MGRAMASTSKFHMKAMLIAIVFVLPSALSMENDFMRCERIVKSWSILSLDDGVKEDKLTLGDLLFFLHVPRTGGRTYFHCFLRKLYTSYQECPRSYDKLRFDPSKTNCRLMVTHDDYSVMSKLPKEKTSVVTILRNPVDRVFSTYEFSVEVAARFLVHPNLTSATQMTRKLCRKARGVSTLDIWPWKYLVPWMREDLFGRRDARRLGRVEEIKEINNSYNMEDIVMPLHLFINDPIAHEIIHNGATFQVAGLTNNSYLTESHEVRHCVRKHPILGQYVLDIAKKRLDNMLYVGLTENHKESATMFADLVGAQVLSMFKTLNSRIEQESTHETDSGPDCPTEELSGSGDKKASETTSTRHVKTANENMTVAKLMEAYEVCISNLRKSQASRHTTSLKKISPVNFSKEARLQVPETVLQDILSLNNLDVELFKHAQKIFAQQQEHLLHKSVKVESQISMWSHALGYSRQKLMGLAITPLFILSIFLFVTSRRRTLKLKI